MNLDREAGSCKFINESAFSISHGQEKEWRKFSMGFKKMNSLFHISDTLLILKILRLCLNELRSQ